MPGERETIKMAYRLVKPNRKLERTPKPVHGWTRERAKSPTVKYAMTGRDKYEGYRREA